MRVASALAAPLIPRYRHGALCDVLPAVATALGARGFTDLFGLPAARRVCVLLIDGLGQHLLASAGANAPALSAMTGPSLTAGFPSTTAVSLTSLATGLPPGEHGMLGYRMRVPGTAQILHSLLWNQPVDPLTWQSKPTVFEALRAQGFAGVYVAAEKFRGSGLTRAAWRGAEYVGIETAGELVATTVQTVRDIDKGLVYAYYPDLDRTGHLRGWQSNAWLEQLAIVDAMVTRVRAGLPRGTMLIVTGDHGMVDIPLGNRVNIDTTHPRFEPQAIGADVAPPTTEVARALADGVELFSGEDRTRYLHVTPGAAADVLATWREVFADRAWVVSRQEAIEAGWFGPTFDPTFLQRVGDVIVAAGPGFSVHASVREPRPMPMPPGLHGSLTPAEQLVPLLVTVE